MGQQAVTETALIDELLAAWDELAPRRVKVNHCILGTRVAIEVGDYFGFRWQPLAVDIAVFNPAGLDQFLQHVPVKDWPPEAHSLGCVCQNELGATAWTGHVIVTAGDLLFDLSGGQFHRPAKDILINRPWVIQKPGDDEGPWSFQNDDDVTMVLWPRPNIDVYRRTKDWRTSYKPLAAEMIRTLKTTETETT